MSRRSRQRRDKRAEIPDEAALSRLMTNGAEAWRTVPDAAAWVDELRGNTMTDTTDQFQPLCDAPTPIGPEVGSGRNMYFAGQHSAEEPADTAARLALVAQRDALLAEVERLRSALESPMQGGMSNDELREAWSKKLPGVEPKDNELTAFALGVEVGNVGRDCYFAERNSARDAWRERMKQCEALASEVERLTAELAAARVDAGKSERRAIMFGDIVAQHVMAMRAAVAAFELEGPQAGIAWIANTLFGPGHMPDVDAVRAEGGAQAMFDREMAEHEAFRAAHPGPATPARTA